MKKLLIFGATELARLAYYYASELGIEILGFVIDDSHGPGTGDIPVFSWSAAVDKFSPDETAFFVAIGYKKMLLREAIYHRVKSQGYDLINIVSKASWVANNVSMQDNNIIMPGVVIEPGSCLGSNNVIWSNATICHDALIGSHNFIAANVTLGGGVRVGNRNFVGFSSVVLQGKRIEEDNLVAANSLVTKNLERLAEYRGAPARKYRSINPDTGVMVV